MRVLSAVLFVSMFASALVACAAAVEPRADGGPGGRDVAGDSLTFCTLSGGGTCAVGASCPAGDGCNSCSCSADGRLACTERACAPDAGRVPCQSTAECGGQLCDGTPGCGTPWFCVPGRACATVLTTYCDCNQVTFTAGGCPGRPIAHVGACEMPPPPTDAGMVPTFACGPIQCTRGSQYCEVVLSDVGGVPNDYTCREFPPSCSSRSCGCLQGLPCGDFCTVNAAGDVRTECGGG